MYRQAAQSWGGLAILLSLVLTIAGIVVGGHPVDSCVGSGPGQYCESSYPYEALGVNLTVVAAMTFLLGIVVLVLSRDLPKDTRSRQERLAARAAARSDFSDDESELGEGPESPS